MECSIVGDIITGIVILILVGTFCFAFIYGMVKIIGGDDD